MAGAWLAVAEEFLGGGEEVFVAGNEHEAGGGSGEPGVPDVIEDKAVGSLLATN